MRVRTIPYWAIILAAASLGPDPRRQAEAAAEEEVKLDPSRVIFYPPGDTARWDSWREALRDWRRETRSAIRYDGSLYRRDDLAWARRNFSCAFVMLWDEMWWDWRRGRFTPEKFLKDGQRRFGGYDSVVLWHAYPRIGFDRRNQFDFYRDMPGGLKGLRKLCEELHQHRVKVFVDYNPWDIGTRREGRDDLAVLADLVKAIEADGIFLDTLAHGSGDFRQLLDAARPGIVLESELPLALENVHDHHLSWAQFGGSIREDGPVGVLRNKWFERRHMLHFIRRWHTDHTAELHAAWLNGAGMLVWENVFGQMRIWSPRDQSILRAMVPIQRRFADLLVGEGWKPLVGTRRQGVYASRWESDGVRLWTLVNRTQEEIDGPLLGVDRRQRESYYDLVRGRQIEAAPAGTKVVLRGTLPARGIGGFAAAPPEKLGSDFSAFLHRQAEVNRRAEFDPGTHTPAEQPRAVRPTRLYTAATLPPGMVRIPAATFEMEVKFTRRECGTYQLPLRRTVKLKPYAIDETPVTNAEFARFLKATNYCPKHAENFLKHFTGGRPPAGKEDHPVVYVDLNDARAYAAWAGKRLPTEPEWQYAAAGPQRRAYPWGERFDATRCNGGQEKHATTAVRAFPQGRSPFAVYDMCGNTWEWTESQRRDGRNRFCVIKGGSYFKAQGSGWYTDGGPQPTHLAAKFLLMWPGLDRCATISFRCVADMKP